MGNKSILMSIQPQYVAKILNGEKTIEVRKKFPKDYVGWVYIYCTKDNKEGLHIVKDKWVCIKHNKVLKECCYNGKVVARFWCDKVEKIRCSWGSNFIDWSKFDERYDYYIGKEMETEDICEVACLKMEELDNYLKMKNGYAIHISKLEVFERPKELKEFSYQENCAKCPHKKYCKAYYICKHALQKAPQSFQFIEGEND